MNSRTIVILLVTLLYPIVSWSHPNHLSYSGFLQGFVHPITGLDHTLAMFAVGIIACSRGKRWLWLLPSTFVTFMILGGFLGLENIALPWSELGITLSVLILGLCISFPKLISTIPLMILLAAFAICHGYAHGHEIPAESAYTSYIIGFVLATLFLHILGVFIGLLMMPKLSWLLRFSGFAMMTCVFWI